MAGHMAPYPNELKMCIKLAGFSVRRVSQETNIPESTLYDWGAGNRVIPHEERQVLASLLGCEVSCLAPRRDTSSLSSIPLDGGESESRSTILTPEKSRPFPQSVTRDTIEVSVSKPKIESGASGLLVPKLWHFIVSDPARRFWHIAHTDYDTPDEMIVAIQAAIKDMNMTTGDMITRRDALSELASIPLISLGRTAELKPSKHEEMLRFCTAALEGCWELSRGNDLEGKRHAYQCVSAYVPLLETIAHVSSQHRKEALNLATRYAILKTLLSWVGRLATPVEAVGCAQKALALSNETGNILLQTSAYTKLTWGYLRNKNYTQAWETIQQGERIIVNYQRNGRGQPLPSGIIGNFHSSYALTQAHNGLNPDTALGMALDSEPLPGYTAFVEFTEDDQHYEAAKIYCLKGDPVRAIEQAAKLIETDTEGLAFLPSVVVLGGVRLYTINHLTSALLQLPEKDMPRIVNAWTIAMQGAQERHNEVMYDEAMQNFAIMKARWGSEEAIRKLMPLTSHW